MPHIWIDTAYPTEHQSIIVTFHWWFCAEMNIPSGVKSTGIIGGGKFACFTRENVFTAKCMNFDFEKFT